MVKPIFPVGSKIKVTKTYAWYKVDEVYTVKRHYFCDYGGDFKGYLVCEGDGMFIHDGFCEMIYDIYPIGSTIVITNDGDGFAWYKKGQTFLVRAARNDIYDGPWKSNVGLCYNVDGVDEQYYVSHKNCRMLKEDEMDDWINVKSKLPLENELVIVWVEGESTGWHQDAQLNHNKVWVTPEDTVVEMGRHIKVTHWQETPKCPKELERASS